MGAPDPRQAVLDELSVPPGTWVRGGMSPGGIESGTVHGGNSFSADLSTVQFVKHRQSERRHLYFVTFEGSSVRLPANQLHVWRYVFPIERDPIGGWRVRGGAGAAGGPPRRPTPWVNLGGGGWPDQFYAGGDIDTAGLAIAGVELRFANGVTLTDDATFGTALFITDEPVELPAVVALLDDAGTKVAEHPAFPEL